ncbi:MAG: M24 family metallopeptidase [Rhodospirillaceae bacterium]|nr:M24 family metallopeptidase [Rhodospirillaceae bacterium]
MGPFERGDYQDRLAKTRTRMADAGLELLLVTDPANMHYLTGYDGWSFYVPQLVAVTVEAGDPVWIGRGIDANGARVTTFLDDGDIYGYDDDYVQTPDRHPMNFVADVLRGRGWDRRVIAVEMDSYYFSARGFEALRHDLPNAAFRDARELVNWVRAVKSDKEIALMQRAGRIMDRVMDVAVDAVSPGVRQCDAVAAILQAQVAGVDDFGGDYTSIVPMLPTGAGTATPHLTWTDEPFREGEATIMELAACHRRYHCPQARTVFLGRPPQRLADAAAAVVEGLNAALDAVRPGVTCGEVEGAWRNAIAKSGLVKESRIGYSTGLNYPPDWGEHTMSLRPGDRSVLQANMTFHMIPGIWQDDWGIEISECFRVTETGAEPFATTPRQLFVKG